MLKNSKLSELRKNAVSFYEKLGFKYEESSPLLHEYFPKSFNMSAGFVQLEPFIHGEKESNNEKIVTIQKCIRHFDRKKAGLDNTHATFFEMFGALTVGGLEREDYIKSIWQFLTEKLGIDSNRLCVTVFKGDTIFGKKLDMDSEALEIWKKIGLKDEQIIFGGKDDVFWFQGGNNIEDNFKISPFDTLLSGYQTEVFFDWDGSSSDRRDFFTNKNRYLEIANNLSIIFEFNPKTKKFSNLKTPASETVFGVERVQSVLENCENIWEIKDFEEFFAEAKKLGLSKTTSQVIFDRLRSFLVYILEESVVVVVGRNGRSRILKGFKQDILSNLFFELDFDEVEKCILKLLEKGVKIMAKYYPKIEERKYILEKFLIQETKKYKDTIKRTQLSIKNYKKKNSLDTLSEKDFDYFYKRFGTPKKIVKKTK